jgi:hypothetical protein
LGKLEDSLLTEVSLLEKAGGSWRLLDGYWRTAWYN